MILQVGIQSNFQMMSKGYPITSSASYLGSMKPFSEGDWIPRVFLMCFAIIQVYRVSQYELLLLCYAQPFFWWSEKTILGCQLPYGFFPGA